MLFCMPTKNQYIYQYTVTPSPRDPDRYAFRNPGTRKTGMIAVNAIFTRK